VPAAAEKRAAWGILAIVGAFGVIYPLVGASLVAALGGEWRIRRGLDGASG
jgi:uncharacterized iron-regulated membrane protein